MKSTIKLLAMSILVLVSNYTNAQISTSEQKQYSALINSLSPTTVADQKKIDSIILMLPPLAMPKDYQFAQLCFCVDAVNPNYKDVIIQMAGVLATDSRLVAKAKVERLWNTNYANFGCDSPGFSVEYGNILKYAVHKGYSQFIESMTEYFGVNINLKDPSDSKTLLDFVRDEIARWSTLKGQSVKFEELKKLYAHLKNDLGAKHSSELK